MTREPLGEMRIGEVLREAREREGLELHEVEARTKIRRKYLRALEDEDWGELPTSSYAKGFLRTYAQLLGLDAEALVDEYRRQIEGGAGEPTYPLGDQPLERHRRRGRGSRVNRLAILVAIAALVAISVVAAIGFSGGDDRQRGERRGAHAGGKGTGTGKGNGKQQAGGAKASEKPEEPTTLALSIRDAVEICLLGGSDRPLIAQVLAPGTEETYTRRQFELRFPTGFDPDQFRLEIAGHRRLLPKADGPVAYAIEAPKKVSELSRPPDEECP